MFKLLKKNHLSALLALLSLSTMSSSLTAQEYFYSSSGEECCDVCPSNRMYIGGFGGGLYSNSTRMNQTGIAFFKEPPVSIGPLAVDARGHARKKQAGFGGVQIGYEWSKGINIGSTCWSIAPAAEIEAFWYKHTKKGHLINPTLSLPEHDFVDSLPMNVGVYLVNGVFSINHSCLGKISPYVGGGIGAARIFVRKAKSIQVAPVELGVNHFNSRRHDSDWAFAAQAKAGLRYNICNRVHIFGEYRFLYVDSSNFNFGATNYPLTHVPTTTWDMRVKDICYNAFAFGVQFDL